MYQELRSLVSRMLHNDPKRRPTAAEAYNYAQMACEAFHDRPSGMTLMVRVLICVRECGLLLSV